MQGARGEFEVLYSMIREGGYVVNGIDQLR
jgi:hypothetical protein